MQQTNTHCSLSEEDGIEEHVRLLLILGDISVGVHVEHLGLGEDGQALDVLQVGVVLAVLGGEVLAAVRELVVVVVNDAMVVIVLEDSYDDAPVVAVSDSATVVTLSSKVADSIYW